MRADSETSDSSGSTTSEKSWECWQAVPYGLVVVVTSVAAILLFPRNNDGSTRNWYCLDEGGSKSTCECPLLHKVSFFGLMIASLGAGCNAAFLWKRAGASAHARSVTGYAVVNWLHSLFGSLLMSHRTDLCIYGSLQSHESRSAAFAVRLCLYLIALLWMQWLIALRLRQLEKTSKRTYCGLCLLYLMGLQGMVVLVGIGLTIGFTMFLSQDADWPLFRMDAGAACLMWFLTIVGSAVAMCSLWQSFHDLRRVLHTAKPAVGRNSSINSCLKESVRFAGRQVAGCMDRSGKNAKPIEPSSAWSPPWRQKVEELSLRGMTLNSLLLFYQGLSSVRGWNHVPEVHKTRDVVRRAIIPLTSKERCAYAVSRLNFNGARRAEVMVTHNWGNNFRDLFAAVLSDALEECSFTMVQQLLDEDLHFLWDILARYERLNDTYWICAFAVNQHISICHSNPYDRDPFTDELHPVCKCECENISDPDGRSTVSEINKFDDMTLDGLQTRMFHLATTKGCRQVIAVDQQLDLFRRAWCVAEIAEAKRLQMDQSLKLVSRATLQRRAHTLENLDIREMGASSAKDKELILGKIENIDKFNVELQSLIFDSKSGLLATWSAMDSFQQIAESGRLIRWGVADAGTGKVWRAWDSAMAPT
eukprot:s1523_g8.t1